jgi:dihydropyrimidinase|nr:dihydropyrimidinase [uncultured Lachnoclostridium sp.]
MKIIKNGTLISSEKMRKADIAIHNNKISEISENISPKDEDEVYDASGCFVFPGFIDGHTHFDMDTGTAHTADDFVSGTKAAVIGGTTTIVDFATQEKGQSLKEAYDIWMKKAKDKSSCNYRFHMAITDWNDRVKEEISKMPELGVTSFKMYMAYDNLISNDAEILACLQKIKEIDGVLGVHCENGTLINELTKEKIAAGETSPSAHPPSRPDYVEAEAINRLAYISTLAGHPVNIVHLSSLAGLNEIRNARKRNQTITVETCPQYLLLDDHYYDLNHFEGAKYVISPPLRKVEDNKALIQAIVDREIDTIATDHCSFNFKKDKELGKEDFRKIPNGAPGVEHRPQLIYTYLVEEGYIDVMRMCELMATNPAKRYGMYPDKGILEVGSDADIVIFSPDYEGVITWSKQIQNVDYTPYEGFKIKGQAKTVFVNGECVVQDGTIVKENQGTYVLGPR